MPDHMITWQLIVGSFALTSHDSSADKDNPKKKRHIKVVVPCAQAVKP